MFYCVLCLTANYDHGLTVDCESVAQCYSLCKVKNIQKYTLLYSCASCFLPNFLQFSAWNILFASSYCIISNWNCFDNKFVWTMGRVTVTMSAAKVVWSQLFICTFSCTALVPNSHLVLVLICILVLSCKKCMSPRELTCNRSKLFHIFNASLLALSEVNFVRMCQNVVWMDFLCTVYCSHSTVSIVDVVISESLW